MEFTPWDPKHITFGFVTDLSLGGACVATDFPLPRGVHVVVRMWPPRCDEEAVLAGLVRWSRSGGMGVKFLSLPGAARKAIQAIVAEAIENANDARALGLEAAQRG